MDLWCKKARGVAPSWLRGMQLAQQSALSIRTNGSRSLIFSPVLKGDEKIRSMSSNVRGAEGGDLGSKILFTVPLLIALCTLC